MTSTSVRGAVMILALGVTGFGPCSKSTDPTPPPAPSKDDAAGFVPVPLANDKGWWGRATGVGGGGAKWELTMSNCTKDPLGPWLGHYTFSAKNGGVTMSGESTSFPAITFKKGFGPEPLTIKVHAKATGSPVKVEIDSTAQVVATLEPMKVLHLVEKKEEGTVKAKGPNGETASMFGSGTGQPVDVPITGNCEGKGDEKDLPLLVPLTPPAKK